MSRLFDRRSSLIVNGLQVDGLRVQFKVKLSHTKHPNTADIVVSNFNKEHRSMLQKDAHIPVILLAGYADDGPSQIFSGVARYVDNGRKGTDWETHIQCGDGEKQFVFARKSLSWGAGTPLSTVAMDLAQASGWGLGNLALALSTPPPAGRPVVTVYAHGYVANGLIATSLDRVLKAGGFTWSVQHGNLRVLRPGKPLQGVAIKLDADSGLIGDPAHSAPKLKGKPSPIKVKALLQAGFTPGGVVRLTTQDLDGQYRIQQVTHVGDTAGGSWFSELEVFPTGGQPT